MSTEVRPFSSKVHREALTQLDQTFLADVKPQSSSFRDLMNIFLSVGLDFGYPRSDRFFGDTKRWRLYSISLGGLSKPEIIWVISLPNHLFVLT